MKKLKEGVLVRKFLFYVMLPSLTVTILGFFFPYVYAMLAVNDAEVCICSYFLANAERDFLLLETKKSFYVLEILNQVTSKCWMLVFVLIMTVMIYRIRHI